MLKEVVVIVWVEERLDSICTLECSNGNVLCGIRKKLWKTAFCTRKSILISEASTNGIQAKVLTMLEEVVVIVWVEERLDSIWTLECSNGNVLCGIRKKLWKTAFCTRKSILISEASTNGIQAKVLTMLEEVVVIVWVEERLDSIWTLECSNRNELCGIRKRLWTTAFCTRKSILISEASTNGIEAKVSTMLEEIVVIVWAEERLYSIWTLEYSIGNVLCGIRKKLWTTAFCTGKSIQISEASTNGIEAKVSTMLEEVVVIVWAEERLDSIWTLGCSNGNVLCGIRKKLWTTVFWTSKSIVISEASTNGI